MPQIPPGSHFSYNTNCAHQFSDTLDLTEKLLTKTLKIEKLKKSFIFQNILNTLLV